MNSPGTYDAWIDVGGTFTDCYVRSPDGQLKRCKVLSSGRVPISLEPVADGHRSKELAADVDHFWNQTRLLAVDARGERLGEASVSDFRNGVLQISGDISETHLAAGEPALKFELLPGVEAPTLGIHRLLGIPIHQSLPSLNIRLGTTRGTNALLTRRGAKTALAITSPFEDLLEIGDQTRPDLFALQVVKPSPLAELVVGIEERLAADGSVLSPLDTNQARRALIAAREQCDSLAICLMHSHLNDCHERNLKQLAAEVGFKDISVSSELAPLIEIVARSQTTVVDAYLSPIIRSYLEQLIAQTGNCSAATRSKSPEHCEPSLNVMTSGGGLVEWQAYSGKDSILSGPAGGVCGLAAIAKALRIPEMIGLDMGGTSTDVCRVSEEHNLEYESVKAGVRILTPTLPITTVASGGGSECWFDGVSLRVGPQSAGAFPGPACYGRGGPLTVTDLNVYLGRLPGGQFPFELDMAAIEQRLDELIESSLPALGITDRRELCDGFRKIAIEQMSEAVRSVSIAQGADPRTHALAGFGGAAGQHICEIAEALGVRTIIDSSEAGMLSALGMGLAPQRLDAVLPAYKTLSDCEWRELDQQASDLISDLTIRLTPQPDAANRLTSSRWLELRYVGTDSTLTIAWDPQQSAPDRLTEEFHEQHSKRYGYARYDHPVELVSIRVECKLESVHSLPEAVSVESRRRRSDGTSRQQIDRNSLQAGDVVLGPAIVLNEGSTLFVDRHWIAECLSEGTLKLSHPERSGAELSRDNRQLTGKEREFDPVFRDCYAARLVAIATQMGLVLQQTAVSVNVKQRRDYSCAIFDSSGYLLASAPHVPVHLGAMGQTVRSILDSFREVRVGDCFITNDPYCGGSHLPDVTVVSPVFSPDDPSSPKMFVANRAHHADIGGITPGSMSVEATRLGDEGVVIPPIKLSDGGVDQSKVLAELFRSSPYPPRNIEENLADIAAQRAANARGSELLQTYARAESWSKLTDYAEHLLSAAEQRVEQFISTHTPEPRSYLDHLDDGTPIKVSICAKANAESQGERASRLEIDFSGTGKVSPTNFNANPSIVTAAVMYVLRCLIADDLPLNEGVLRCIDLYIPHGVLNPKPAEQRRESPAVAAGNVETSQRVVDVLLGAWQAAAASQGTMNNLLFGNQSFGFYETICGGAGATKNSAGASAVHTHMTNTRLTDPEVLEAKYPIRLRKFRLRKGSGGDGRQPGGDGVEREIEFLEAVTFSLLSSRRGEYPPFGLDGGHPGLTGENIFVTQGKEINLPGCCTREAQAGDRLRIMTPGGGGFGRSSEKR